MVSRSQPLDAPAGAVAPMPEPVMEVFRPSLPKLDDVRTDDVAAPTRRAPDRAAVVNDGELV